MRWAWRTRKVSSPRTRRPARRRNKLKAAAAAIGKAYPAEDVSLYLSTLLWQDAETWGALSDAPERQAPEAAEKA